jgi:hypothetical protein
VHVTLRTTGNRNPHSAKRVQITLAEATRYYRLAAGLSAVTASEQNALPTTALSGHRAALFHLDRYCEFGHGVAKNAALAAEFYQLAADKGDGVSQVTIGFFRERGIGVEQDIAEAVQNYQAAAQNLIPAAMGYCGLCPQYGIGFDVNLDEASSFYLSPDTEAILDNNALRCRRSLNKARLGDHRLQKRRHAQSQIASVDNCASARLSTVPPSVEDYRTSPVGMRHSKVIATGAFGVISVSDDPAPLPTIAVKHFAEAVDIQTFLREVGIMVELDHPCVLRILNWALPDGGGEAEIHTEFAAHGVSNRFLRK